eukprot:3339076-Amphidinium_carterae.2
MFTHAADNLEIVTNVVRGVSTKMLAMSFSVGTALMRTSSLRFLDGALCPLRMSRSWALLGFAVLNNSSFFFRSGHLHLLMVRK